MQINGVTYLSENEIKELIDPLFDKLKEFERFKKQIESEREVQSRLITVQEACQILNLKPDSLRKGYREGRYKGIRSGKKILFTMDEIKRHQYKIA